MGLFSSIGKIAKGIGKGVGKVASTGIGIASNLNIPVVSTAARTARGIFSGARAGNVGGASVQPRTPQQIWNQATGGRSNPVTNTGRQTSPTGDAGSGQLNGILATLNNVIQNVRDSANQVAQTVGTSAGQSAAQNFPLLPIALIGVGAVLLVVLGGQRS